MPSTVRTELDHLKFDWKSGTLAVQDSNGRHVSPPRVIEHTDPVLDQKYSNGAGFMDMPRVVASDENGIYIPYKDTQGSRLLKVLHSSGEYVEHKVHIPYPEQ